MSFSWDSLMHAHIYIAVDCGTLTNPANGQVTYTAGTLFGQTATYSCDSGYNLVGESVRTCQATGVWSGSAPTCQGIKDISLGSLVSTSNILYKQSKLENKPGSLELCGP